MRRPGVTIAPGLIAVAVAAFAGSASAAKLDKITSQSVRISYRPNSFVIGNAYAGWHVVREGAPVHSPGPGNPTNSLFYWGFIMGSFGGCGWLQDASLASGHSTSSICGAPQAAPDPGHVTFIGTYTDGIINSRVSDGSRTKMHYGGRGCTTHRGYGNVEPWKIPATPADSLGTVPNGHALLWRYVSHDGSWVLVHDTNLAWQAGHRYSTNWFFVHRGCVSLAKKT